MPVLAVLTAGALVAGVPEAIGSLDRTGALTGSPGRSRGGIEGLPFAIASLDGGGNNLAHPTWGKAGQPYLRVAPPAYADGVSQPVPGPNARAISNRIVNDRDQNVFSERRVTQWGWTWGQFLDHTFGLREETGPTATEANIPFDPTDPMESFTNTLGVIPFSRTNATAGTGTDRRNPREQTNTTSTLLNASAVYGGTPARLDWLRAGPVDGNPTNNDATLLLADGYLPRRTSRGTTAADLAAAPNMAIDGRLLANPESAMVAGDVRANENLALTAVHTLFAREHNRIVSLLPGPLSEEAKFQIARRIVIAEQQFITYQEFLPSLGVALPRYTGYKSAVNPTLSNEFATVGYRAHSQIHGEFEFEAPASDYTADDLAFFERQGLEVEADAGMLAIAVPLNAAFFNPELFQRLRLEPLLESLAESQYRNDEQIDNQLRSVLFQIPAPDNPGCAQGPDLTPCFSGVVDLAAIDIERARDHGIPRYNALRRAYGLAPKASFTALTGEATDAFPAGTDVNNPTSLDITSLADIDGNPVEAGGEGATREVRRTSIAARLKAIYADVNAVDAFVGMIAEPHVPGTEFGELQLAIWTKQFQALRDGDRFFFGNDPALRYIRDRYRIDYRHSLAEVIAANSELDADGNVFLVADDDLPPAACEVSYTIRPSRSGTFRVDLAVTNTSETPVRRWALRFELANGQRVRASWNSTVRQSGPSGRDITVTSGRRSSTIAAGATVDGFGFEASWDNLTNAKPPNISLNHRRCAVG